METGAEHAVCEQVARDGWEGWLVEGLAQTTAIQNATFCALSSTLMRRGR